jgi:hypothetical protein
MVMTRFATPLILAALLAMGGNRTPSPSQVKSQSNPPSPVPVEQQGSKKPATPEALKAEIDALKAAKPAWREIAWKSCLLEGLKESRARNKPALLWVFIDRPADDARC